MNQLPWTLAVCASFISLRTSFYLPLPTALMLLGHPPQPHSWAHGLVLSNEDVSQVCANQHVCSLAMVHGLVYKCNLSLFNHNGYQSFWTQTLLFPAKLNPDDIKSGATAAILPPRSARDLHMEFKNESEEGKAQRMTCQDTV